MLSPVLIASDWEVWPGWLCWLHIKVFCLPVDSHLPRVQTDLSSESKSCWLSVRLKWFLADWFRSECNLSLLACKSASLVLHCLSWYTDEWPGLLICTMDWLFFIASSTCNTNDLTTSHPAKIYASAVAIMSRATHLYDPHTISGQLATSMTSKADMRCCVFGGIWPPPRR